MYWFREPMGETLNGWFLLTERSFQWGRSPQIGWTKRPLRGFFTPIKGYVAPLNVAPWSQLLSTYKAYWLVLFDIMYEIQMMPPASMYTDGL